MNEIFISKHVVKFVSSLTPHEAAKFSRTIELLGELGTSLGRPHTRQVRRKLWELRFQANKKFYRIFYFASHQNQFVLIHMYRKQSNQTPNREISTALKRMEAYLNNHD